MGKIKKMTALFLVLVMCVTIIPANQVFAVESEKVIYSNDFEADSDAVDIGGDKAIEFSVAGDVTNGWVNVFQKELGYEYTDKINSGATLSFDILLPPGSTYEGSFKANAAAKMGTEWVWTKSPDSTIQVITIDDFSDSVSENVYRKTSVSIALGADIEALQGLHAVIPCLAASNCDYSGKIYLDNVKLIDGDVKQVDTNLPAVETLNFMFDKEEEINAWTDGGKWDYDGGLTISHNETIGEGAMQLDVDYSANKESSWSEAKIQYNFANPKELEGYNKFSFDFIYDPTKMTAGSFKAKLNAGSIAKDIAIENEEEYGDGLKKATVVIEFASAANLVGNFIIGIIGSNTDYKGSIYIDTIAFSQVQGTDTYVDATKTIQAQTAIAVNADSIVANALESKTSSTIKLVDDKAIAATTQLYAYLEAVGKTDSVLYGHQNDIHHKAGNAALSNSDTKDITGSIAAVVGIDTLSLTGNELGSWEETQAERVAAAAAMTKEATDQGAIITLSAHMPNFEVIDQRVKNNIPGSTSQNDLGILSDGTYNFSGYTPGTLTGDIVKRIMPGQDLNYVYTAYLDMIAAYGNTLEEDDITVLFRPFHENTGSWFWWGAAFCDTEAYKNLFKYTVEYLRDEKNVHNFIYVYGPSSDAENVADYEKRYPGDAYVDMVGFDMYHQNPAVDDNFIDQFKTQLSVVEQFATEHNKLFAVTETGVANEGRVLYETGNARKDWYNEILEAVAPSTASYFLLWANFGTESGFYTPYVVSKTDTTMRGHEMLDNFIDFYNDPKSVFASQTGAFTTINTAVIANTDVTGYITAPISGSRVLKAVTVEARVSNAKENSIVQFLAKNKTGEIVKEIVAKKKENGKYIALLTDDVLKVIGESAGTISLIVDDKVCNTINIKFNMPEAIVDPAVVDTFENYYGENSVMNASWSTGKGTGCTIVPSLFSKKYEGDYGLEFKYSLVAGGYVGVSKSLNGANWSNKNALQFWTVPDGKNQKVVVQVTSGGNVFEIYLNDYEKYKNSTEPTLVTIPFSSFVGRDNKLAAFNTSSIESFGLWCNAIVPTGTDAASYKLDSIIYYDNIKAVTSDVTAITFTKADNTGSTGNTGGTGNTGSTSDTSSNTETGSGTTTSLIDVKISSEGLITATIKVEVKVENGQAITSLTKEQIQKAISDINKTDASEGKAKTALTLQVDLPAGVKQLDIDLSKEILKIISDSTTEGVFISTSIGSITFNTSTLSSILSQTGSGCKLSLAVEYVGYDQVRQLVGDRPIYSLQLQTDNKTELKLDGKGIKVELPYEKQSGENNNSLIVYTLDKNNKLKIVTNSFYDSNKNVMILKADSLTKFVIGYNKKDFKDVTNHWAKDSIEKVAALELFKGIGGDNFAPNTPMTRGMFVTVLSRLVDIENIDTNSTTYTDVSEEQWYTKEVEWAAANGIATGVSTTKFEPNREITREEMAVMLDNYMKYAEIKIAEPKIELFSDKNSISSWANASVHKMKAIGILSGKDNNVFDPKAKATRAEVATILVKLIEVSVK